MVSKFDDVEIPIPKIKEWFAKHGSIQVGKFVWTMKSTSFYNQISIGYEDVYSKKSIKLFPNGSIQVSGCSDLFDCRRVTLQVKAILWNVAEVEVTLGDFRVVMINSNFSLNYHLNLFAIVAHFEEAGPMFDVSFDPDRYSAVKIKFKPASDMKRITASIFSTGRIIVTGAETLKEIAYAYNIINQHIRTSECIKVKPMIQQETFDVILGYKIPELCETLRHKGFKPWDFVEINDKINF